MESSRLSFPKAITFLLLGLVLGISVGYVAARWEVDYWMSEYYALKVAYDSLFEIPENVTKIAENINIVIIESETENRTLYLDPDRTYCSHIVLYGGQDPYPWDLYPPYGPIVFYFLEDIKDTDKADNYSDLIVRMNQIIDRDGKMKMVVVFFAEGAYEKVIYYRGMKVHHYNDMDPTTNYNITLVDMEDLQIEN